MCWMVCRRALTKSKLLTNPLLLTCYKTHMTCSHIERIVRQPNTRVHTLNTPCVHVDILPLQCCHCPHGMLNS